MGERTLLLGYDLGNKKTQMAVYDKKTREPILIGQSEDENDTLIDTSIALDGMEPVTGFVEKIRRGESIEVDGKISQPENVLAHFFRKTLSLTRRMYPGETILQLVVTVEDASKEFVQIIYEALEKLGIERDRALVIGHKQAFLYYVLYQKKEIWINDVGLFDHGEKSLTYYQMKVERSKTPTLVGVQEKDYTDALDFLDTDQERRAAVFENVVYGAIHKQLLSALYMTGEGFENDWADGVFRKLCVGRRLFKGSNLYVNGACYAAKEIVGPPLLDDYLLMDEDMINANISLRAYQDAEIKEIVLAKAGTPWYMVDEEIDIIPDGDNEICLLVNNVLKQKEKQLMLELDPVSARIDKHCRIGMRIRFASAHTCVVTLKDKGFGEMFKTSNRIWEKSFEIG